MKAKGKITEKDQVAAIINEAKSKARNEVEFIEIIESKGYAPYFRNGKLAGVEGKMKYRINILVHKTKFNLQNSITLVK